MKILAIDTSSLSATVALSEDGKLIAEYTVIYKMTHSQIIMPIISEIKERIGLSLDTLDYIAVSSGPGSFTGLRIGAATAKGLGLALKIPIIPVPTLDALAYNIIGFTGIMCPIMDARRGEVYSAFYEWQPEGIKRLSPYYAKPFNEILSEAIDYNMPVMFLGDGVFPYKEKIKESNFYIAPLNSCLQRGASLALAAEALAFKGKFVESKDFVPEYLRRSQAERERDEKKKAEGK